jgi:membrane protein
VDQPQAQQAALEALRPYLPAEALGLVGATLDGIVRTRGTATTVATIGLLWSATAATGSLRHALNRVLRAPRPRAFWHRKLVELMLVIFGGLFLGLSVIASATLGAVQNIPGLSAAAEMMQRIRGIRLIGTLGPWIFSALAFLVVYRFLPNVRLSWRSLRLGVLVAMLLFEGMTRAFFWYLRTLGAYPLVYGPLAGLFVFMGWVYLVAVLVLLAAETMVLVEYPFVVSGRG